MGLFHFAVVPQETYKASSLLQLDGAEEGRPAQQPRLPRHARGERLARVGEPGCSFPKHGSKSVALAAAARTNICRRLVPKPTTDMLLGPAT